METIVWEERSNGIDIAVRFRSLLCSRIRGEKRKPGKKEGRTEGERKKSRDPRHHPLARCIALLPRTCLARVESAPMCSLISRSSSFLAETGESTGEKREKRDVRSADSRKVSPRRVSSGLNGNSLTRPLKADTSKKNYRKQIAARR